MTGQLQLPDIPFAVAKKTGCHSRDDSIVIILEEHRVPIVANECHNMVINDYELY